MLDSAAGNGLANLRDSGFVSGYAWRRGTWLVFEPSKDAYDFSTLDAVVAALEPMGQKLTLTLFATEVPAYLVNDPAVEKWDPIGAGGAPVRTAAPWDPIMLGRYELLIKALADHRLPDASKGGAMVALRDHPVLAQAHAPVPGLGSILFKNPSPTSLTTYSRTRFHDGLVRAFRAVVDQFPGKYAYAPFYPVNDSTTSPTLTDATLARLTTEFNLGPAPRLGFFQENLTGTGPNPNGFAAHLVTASATTYIMFQACWSWSGMTPPQCTIGASQTPADGLKFGRDNFGARYFELYVADVDNAAYQAELQTWATMLASP